MMVRASILLVLAGAAIAAHYAEVPPAVRVLAALPFLLVGPGLAWLDRTDDLGIVALAATGVGLSLAAEAAIGSVLLISGLWSPQAGFAVLLATSVAGLWCTGRGDASAEVMWR